jgi:glucosamine-6-phosphate deaminase
VSVVVVDEARFAVTAADAVQSRLPSARPRLGVATGGTPERVYTELARRSRAGELDLADAVLVALDEYVGLSGDDPRSYATYVRDLIAGPLGVPPESVLTADGAARDPDREAVRLDAAIAAIGGIDVQILGLGGNGHIGFNEPGSALDSPSRTVTLDEQTRGDNARYFCGEIAQVPRRAITQGLGTISRARAIVLLAVGGHKARPLAAALHGPMTTQVPASVLQRHPDVTVIADHAAAALL